ncbi:MAG: hypothetical protein IPH13_03805 [Planctomycetes bacterium]|nr:hypothetical protein [Planctomycetota bacterium]
MLMTGDATAAPTDALERIARLVPRDAHVVLFVDDRAAFTRRARRTDLIEAFDTVDGSLLDDCLQALEPQVRALVPLPILAEASWLFTRGSGPVALAVDGFVTTERGAEPDYLVLADAHGLTGLAATLRFLANDAKRDDAFEALEAFDLPFELDEDVDVAFTSHRGLDLIEVDDEVEGHHFAVCQVGDLVIAGKTATKVREAADRALDDSVASLAQNRRFQTFWRNAGGANGSLFCFVDLRRVRQSSGAFTVGNWAVRAALDGPFADVDGIAASLRAVGSSFECEAFLEQRSAITSDSIRKPASQFRDRSGEPRAFGFHERLGARVAFVDAKLSTATEAARALYAYGLTTGAIQLPNIVMPNPSSILGEFGDELAPLLGGEFAVAQLAQDSGGEFLPRMAFALEVKDMNALRALFERRVRRFIPPGILLRELDDINDGYECVLAGGNVFSRPAVALRGRFMVGASSAAALRDVLRYAEAPLGGSSEFLEAHDRLDVAADAVSTRWTYVHPRHFVESFSAWVALVHRWPDVLDRSGEDEDVVDSVREILEVVTEWVDDPDLGDALHGSLLRFEEFDGGVRVRFVGP